MPDSPDFDTIAIRGSLDLALPTIEADAWCHPACYQRWAGLPRDTQGLLGGHIHYDVATASWSVPFPITLRLFAQFPASRALR